MGISSTSPWLAYYGNTPASLDYPNLTMYQMVAQAARRHPGHTAYVFMGKKTTYQEFMRRIEAALICPLHGSTIYLTAECTHSYPRRAAA